MIQEDLITYKTAVLAKNKGFDDVECNNDFYIPPTNIGLIGDDLLLQENTGFIKKQGDTWILRPSQSLLAKWLRVNHNIHIQIYTKVYHKDKTHYNLTYWCIGLKLRYNPVEIFKSVEDYNTYEECFEYALQEALKLI